MVYLSTYLGLLWFLSSVFCIVFSVCISYFARFYLSLSCCYKRFYVKKNFFLSIMYSATLLNSLTSSCTYFVDSLWFFYVDKSCLQQKTVVISSFPIYMPLFLSLVLLHWLEPLVVEKGWKWTSCSFQYFTFMYEKVCDLGIGKDFLGYQQHNPLKKNFFISWTSSKLWNFAVLKMLLRDVYSGFIHNYQNQKNPNTLQQTNCDTNKL